MFVDAVTVTLVAGCGGNGVVAWRREKFIPKGGPSGGNGGNGGSVILRTNSQIYSLDSFRNKNILKASSGQSGGGALKQGKNGESLTIEIPCGTIVRDARTKEVLYDCTEDKTDIVICKGGRGGKGNNTFKSPTHQAPNICTEGTAGESIEVEFELKLIADVGLVGMPNAGKSTFLSNITHAIVKIGAYPFTTLFPNLSYVQFDDYSRVLVADIPGIIQDAHQDRGLGLSFLKHIERTSVLVFLIDISGWEGRDPLEDFEVLQDEIRKYNPEMLEKPFLIALNKIDTEGAEENIARFQEKYDFGKSRVFPISAKEKLGLAPLLEKMKELAQLETIRY